MLAPRAEVCGPDGLVLEIPHRYQQDTLNRLDALTGRDVRIGGGSSRTTAILAAKFATGTILEPGKEANFVASLPVEALTECVELDTRILSTLTDWGIRTLGELASLPRNALVARLGQKGVALQSLARGEDSEFFPLYHPQPEFREEQDLDWTINLLEPLVFLIGGMLADLCGRLRSQGLAVESILTRFQLSDGSRFERTLSLALPMQDFHAILSLIRLDLQNHPPQAGVTAISLQAIPGRPRIFQHSLLHPTAPQPEKLAQTLTRLKAIAGAENVGSPRVLDTHRPDAVLLEELSLDPSSRGAARAKRPHPAPVVPPKGTSRLTLRRLRPPRPVDLHNEQILSCAGPWRSSGDWWTNRDGDSSWSRDEWDIERPDGVIYRVFWDHQNHQWFMEGIYD
jgi:protein ImuB